MSIKHLVDITNFNTFRLQAYKSYGEVTGTVLIHLVIDNGENTFEHIIDLNTLEGKNGHKALKMLYNFSSMLTKEDLKNIRKMLILFANSNNESVYRYDGYTTEKIHKHILELIRREDIIKQDYDFMHVSADTLILFVKYNQGLYNRHYEEVVLQLVCDEYIQYYRDGSIEYYKIKLDKEKQKGE